MFPAKLYEQEDYIRPTKEQQERDCQAKNNPIKDGFTRSAMVQNQPSEIQNMKNGGQGVYHAEWENEDIERTR